MDVFGSKEAMVARAERWACFNHWERSCPLDRPFEAVLADVEWSRRLLPEQVRGKDSDPEKRGVGVLHRRLAVLGNGR